MAVQTIYTCDVCGDEIDENSRLVVTFKNTTLSLGKKEIDVCYECEMKLVRTWSLEHEAAVVHEIS